MAEKTKKRLEEAAQSGSTEGIIDPPSPIRCHVKWKMARTKKTGQMTSEAAMEIAEKIPDAVPISVSDAITGTYTASGGRGWSLRFYEGSTTVYNIPLLHGQVKVGVEKVKDVEALIPVPTDEVAVSPAKPPESPDHEVDDPLYLMTLTIPHLFLKPLQVMWDATVFGVFNQNFPLYIKHEDLFEIVHDGQCLSISVIQLWIQHMTETSMRAGNSDVYGFLEPQSIQRTG
ncbi:hypothetical protein GmHk_06G017061 [Glycine max]|nr:hypothetical protein GmHk_06G017061 [Glycine max]KAH1247096.1 hypothetical protein GmHk_06G017061 [Glycine max]KAH1247097.1 hypothetical protein GmHk_06G017061 [Glycine max]